MTYELIQQMDPAFPVASLCEVLGVSRAAYYRYLSGQTYQPSEQEQKQIKALEDAFWDHKRRYGSRRLVWSSTSWSSLWVATGYGV